ncbi:MAG: UvrD-helicase domain-containing protein [Anaerolineae bacterium]
MSSHTLTLSRQQLEVIQRPVESKIFLLGPAGAGKTTAGVGRLLHLLETGIRAESILVVAPQRTLARPYYEALRSPELAAGGQVTVLTVGGLARRMVDLFWPLVAEKAGFGQPHRRPSFLTLETAQYYMASVARPFLDQGYFETVVIDRNRLYSQILDNLNKAAVVGFPHSEIGERLKAAWGGEPSEKRIYDEAQDCATHFREYCLAHNLLDFSLQVEVFASHLWPLPLCRDYLLNRYTHLIVENVEEDTPVAHDLLGEWLRHCQSALLIYDEEAGYRRFLGADPVSARALSKLCDDTVEFTDSYVTSCDLDALGYQVARSLKRPTEPAEGDVRAVLTYEHHRYHPQMLDWVAEEIGGLVRNHGISPGEIVVLAPFLTDALRFSLMNRLEQLEIPVRSHRPSRALREEPATQCLLTLAAIAHPGWGICPSRFDVAYALMQAIEGMDLVRAQLLAEIVYRVRDEGPTLSFFDQINAAMQERLTFALGGRYERLRTWIVDYIAGPEAELDHFLGQLFGEVLSQEGHGFHHNYDAGEVAANLIESVQKFRWVTGDNPMEEEKPLGKEYIEMVQDGVVAAQYIRSWQLQPDDAVLLAPAYTFLMSNRPVDYQFWLNVGGRGWWERLYQPLTHPYVLSRHWPRDRVWTDEDEFETRQEALHRLTRGLIRRCRRGIFLGLSELGEQGYGQQGPLLQAIQRVLRGLPAEPEVMSPASGGGNNV